MPKLHLKRTPQEAARQRRKQKHSEHSHDGQDINTSTTSTFTTRKHYCTGTAREHLWASSDEDPEESLPPYQEHYQWSSDKFRDVVHDEEEQRFREKMFDALHDDEYLDSLEARLNDFAHVPERWRSAGGSTDRYGVDDTSHLDPQNMGDEEYVEWIRLGMYRRTHAKEYAESERKRALKAARRAEEKARRAETKRLERVSAEHRKRKKLERDIRRKEIARTEYHLRWKEFSQRDGDLGLNGHTEIRFSDIPWPVLVAYPDEHERRIAGLRPVTIEDLTPNDISDFLLVTPPVSTTKAGETEKRQRKEILKETFLRFHPDKFEGRYMQRVYPDERDAVREAIGQVVCTLNFLMNEDG